MLKRRDNFGSSAAALPQRNIFAPPDATTVREGPPTGGVFDAAAACRSPRPAENTNHDRDVPTTSPASFGGGRGRFPVFARAFAVAAAAVGVAVALLDSSADRAAPHPVPAERPAQRAPALAQRARPRPAPRPARAEWHHADRYAGPPARRASRAAACGSAAAAAGARSR
jgi:hypothetical protein